MVIHLCSRYSLGCCHVGLLPVKPADQWWWLKYIRMDSLFLISLSILLTGNVCNSFPPIFVVDAVICLKHSNIAELAPVAPRGNSGGTAPPPPQAPAAGTSAGAGRGSPARWWRGRLGGRPARALRRRGPTGTGGAAGRRQWRAGRPVGDGGNKPSGWMSRAAGATDQNKEGPL